MTCKKLTVLLTVAASFCLPAARGQSLGPVMMPGADLMVQIRLDKIQSAPIFLAMKEMKEKEKESLSQSPLAGIGQADEFAAAFGEITGLESSDLLTLAASVQLDGMDLENGSDLNSLEALFGLSLAKEVSIDKLEAGLRTFAAKEAEKNGTTPAVISRSNGMLEIKAADDKRPVYVAMAAGDKAMVIGSKKAVEGALERYTSGRNISPTTLFPASIGKVVGTSNYYMIVKPTAEMVAKMKSQSEANPNPVAAVMAKIQSAGIGVNFGETLNLSVIGDFGGAEVAQQASMLMDAQFVSGVKMFATMMTGGTPLPVLQTMKTGTGDGGTAWFKMSLSKADFELFAKAAKEKQQQMMQNNAAPGEEW